MKSPPKEWKNKIQFGRTPKTDQPRKKKRLKYIAVLPSFITLMNGACGFIAIVFASQTPEIPWSLLRYLNVTSFALVGYIIILAMVADMLDGRVARLTRTTSDFGGQLDSLCDTISFGIAPAFLMMKMAEFYLESIVFENQMFSVIISRGIFFAAIFYVMCAVVRLARFNVENEEDEAAHMNFAGLPSPAAAGAVVSLIIFYQQFLSGIAVFQIIMVIGLPVVTFFAGFLMVSRLRYPHIPNHLLRAKKTLPSFLLIFACGIFIIWNIQLAMLAGFCGFMFFGVCRWIIGSFTKKTPQAQA